MMGDDGGSDDTGMMDWLRVEYPTEDMTIHNHGIFQHGLGDSHVIEIGYNAVTGSSASHSKFWPQLSDLMWESWFGEKGLMPRDFGANLHRRTEGICLILLERSGSEFPHFSISQHTMSLITKQLFVHESITTHWRESPYCSVQLNAWGSRAPGAVVYNCRTSESWPGGMALTVTYFPDRRYTYALMYGSLAAVEQSIPGIELDFHPLTLPTMLAVIERERHFEMLDPYIAHLTLHLANMKDQTQVSNISTTSSNSETQDTPAILASVPDWIEMIIILEELHGWKAELTKFVKHSTELDSIILGEATGTPTDGIQQRLKSQDFCLKAELMEIIDEYNVKIGECRNLMYFGNALATRNVCVKLSER
ncbi:hypothetical protein GGR54DRAFT_611503 [Hypoxylon sp. NC1633]|nr:hypothetical protein GGR54DRAFT_611503 [Hypoxylon sp. NC1633]